MKVKEYKRTRNKLGGVHVEQIIKEVPDPVDYSQKMHNEIVELKNELDDRLSDLKDRQKKIASKVGVKE